MVAVGLVFYPFFFAMELISKRMVSVDFNTCAFIKNRKYSWTGNLRKLQATMEALAAAANSEAAGPPQSFAAYAQSLHQRLQEASNQENIRLSNSTYVRAHLVRKLLILRLQREGEWDRYVQLGWEDFQSLQLPDEDSLVQSLPVPFRNIGMIEAALCCPAIMLSCFACLAKPVLKKNRS